MGILFEFAAKLRLYGPTLKPRGFVYINQVGYNLLSEKPFYMLSKMVHEINTPIIKTLLLIVA
jgi:hypothetical protein